MHVVYASSDDLHKISALFYDNGRMTQKQISEISEISLKTLSNEIKLQKCRKGKCSLYGKFYFYLPS
jgi:DNA-binding transcriptional regulator LsrR (DeoR family)